MLDIQKSERVEFIYNTYLVENNRDKERRWNFSKHGITPARKMAANDNKQDEDEITLAKIYAELQAMWSDFHKKIETIKSEILVAVDDKLENWKKKEIDDKINSIKTKLLVYESKLWRWKINAARLVQLTVKYTGKE